MESTNEPGGLMGRVDALEAYLAAERLPLVLNWTPPRDLASLAYRCKGDVTLTINGERSSYETRQEYLTHGEGGVEDPAELARLLESQQLYELQFYPETPVGFNLVRGTTVQEVLDQAHAILDRGWKRG